MQFSTGISPHLPARNSVTKVMLQVLLALIPGTIAMVWFFGFSILINLGLAILTAVISEAFVLGLRKRPVLTPLQDLSAVVTAVLLALALPALVPWWITVIGTAFAILIAKHLYGGLGYNPFNPAMVGYVLLLVSFPRQMTAWIAPSDISTVALSMRDVLQIIFLEQIPANISIDGLTMATPLDTVKTQLGLNQMVSEITLAPVFGLIAGKGWEWISLAYLIGGLWLIKRSVIAWQIPVGLLAGLTFISGIYFLVDSSQYTSPFFQLFSGATMLGAFFIATDPVTASTTPNGRLIYGAMIGLLIYVIRVWGGFPDAVAFSVLLMNLAAPTIDYYTRPRVFGQQL